jgi:hypothetical protein
MRDIGTKELGVTVLAVAMLQWACDGGSPTGPSPDRSPVPVVSSPASLAGTWRGGDSGTGLGLVWQLSQDRARVDGSSQIFGREGWTADRGSVVGTVAGSSFDFSETHPAGTSSKPGCTAELQGTLHFHSLVDRPQIPPSRYWGQEPPDQPEARESLSGRISGHTCDGPVDMNITLVRD